MNLNRFLNMVANILVRRLVNFGINRGIASLGRDRSATAEAPQTREARALAKRARQAARIARRLGR